MSHHHDFLSCSCRLVSIKYSLFFSPLTPPQPLQIKSVVAPDHVKGYIYVESYKQTHVKSAIEGIGNLRMGLWNQQMVPIKEMTDVLKVVKEVTNLKPKSWVRLKRGLYKDDIAQVPTDDASGRKKQKCRHYVSNSKILICEIQAAWQTNMQNIYHLVFEQSQTTVLMKNVRSR